MEKKKISFDEALELLKENVVTRRNDEEGDARHTWLHNLFMNEVDLLGEEYEVVDINGETWDKEDDEQWWDELREDFICGCV